MSAWLVPEQIESPSMDDGELIAANQKYSAKKTLVDHSCLNSDYWTVEGRAGLISLFSRRRS